MSSFYLSTYLYAHVRLKNIGQQYKAYELIEDIKTLTILDQYTRQDRYYTDETSVRSISALRDSINGKPLQNWWHLDTIFSKPFSMDSVTNVFRKYDMPITFKEDLSQLKNDENYIKQRDSLNQYINYIVEVKYFKEKEQRPEIFGYFIHLFLISFLVLLHKTSANTKFAWVYAILIIATTFNPYTPTTLKWISSNTSIVLFFIGVSLFLFIYGLIKKKQTITLQAYAVALITIQFIGLNLIEMWASSNNIYYIIGPIALFSIFLFINSIIQTKVLAKPFNTI